MLLEHQPATGVVRWIVVDDQDLVGLERLVGQASQRALELSRAVAGANRYRERARSCGSDVRLLERNRRAHEAARLTYIHLTTYDQYSSQLLISRASIDLRPIAHAKRSASWMLVTSGTP